ncbi:hypothetical protein AB0K80_00550 [Streptomyces sp. NPDC052682]|uniref:hypothetical protein n=1 Tax=Streptomyces sp. NPDC052682 TaxID=3154954 RepID=UPI00341A4D78
MVTLVGILEHAHARLAELSDADEETIAEASGTVLIPSLCARAGLASVQGRRHIPLLPREIGLLEAAVVNLESYGGNEVVLVAGYDLLDRFARRRNDTHPLRQVHGILAFVHEPGGPTDGPARPSVPDGEGPERVS